MFCEGSCESYVLEKRQPGFFKRALRRCLGVSVESGVITAPDDQQRMATSEGTVIRKGELCVLGSPGRFTIFCIQGIAWVTCPGRFCDYIIHEGESMILRGSGKLIVSGGSDNVRVRICRS